MTPRQALAYYHFAISNKNRELGILLNLHAMAAQGGGRDIKEAVEMLLKDS